MYKKLLEMIHLRIQDIKGNYAISNFARGERLLEDLYTDIRDKLNAPNKLNTSIIDYVKENIIILHEDVEVSINGDKVEIELIPYGTYELPIEDLFDSSTSSIEDSIEEWLEQSKGEYNNG